MSKLPFRFKQFTVAQNNCAMKVNTDGVLLGAWSEADNATKILDIGTGTGVIALMMAQKNPAAKIDAIDIDLDACTQAQENFEQSPWSNRLNAVHVSLQHYQPAKLYDIIISNPPYFIDDQKTESPQKNIAKHSVALSYADLLSGISRLLDSSGKAFVVLPEFNFGLFKNQAAAVKLFITKHTLVTAVKDKVPYLSLVQIEHSEREYLKTNITIQDSTGNFTDEYKTLTKDFYLKF